MPKETVKFIVSRDYENKNPQMLRLYFMITLRKQRRYFVKLWSRTSLFYLRFQIQTTELHVCKKNNSFFNIHKNVHMMFLFLEIMCPKSLDSSTLQIN